MTPRNGDTAATGSKKRPADDGFDPENDEISLDSTAPYDVKKEHMPCSVLQSKEYATYKAHEETFKQLLKGPLANVEHIDKSPQGLIKTINKDIDGPEPQKIVLCLAGPMGVGKSATLNSLLGIKNIAREDDSGGSCTLTSCMYQGAKKGQETAFLAQVTFFTRNERRELFSEYLAEYYDATHDSAEDDDETAEGQQSQVDGKTPSEIRNEVTDTFFRLFGKQHECRTKQHVRDYLDAAESRQDENILRQFLMWSEDLIAKATAEKTVVTVAASTADELSKKLEEFTALAQDDNGNPAVSLTPMVSLVAFYFDNPLTRLGIVFLDTPGTSDRNKARRKSSQTYRRLRTHCAILSDASRAKDDGGIWKEVKSLGKRSAGRMLVVITKSDSMNGPAASHGSRRERDHASHLKTRLERIKKALNAADIELSDAMNKNDMQRLGPLVMEKNKLEVRVKLATNAEIAHRMHLRSESTKSEIEEKLRDSNTSAPIFSVSNLEYMKHMAGYDAKNTPVLTIEQTNIPDLHRSVSALPTEARLNELKHQQEHTFGILLHEIRLYTEKTSSDRKESLELHVQHPMKYFADDINRVFTEIEQDLSKLVRTIAAQEPAWIKLAGRLCDKWAREFKTPVSLDLLKRDGHRRGNCRNREVDLSGELAEISSAEIDDLFYKLGPRLRDYEKNVLKELRRLVSQMVEDLKSDSNESYMALDAFYAYVYAKNAQLPVIVKAAFDRFIDKLDDIRLRLTSAEEDAYLVQAMLPIYDEVRHLKGGKDSPGPRPKVGWPVHRRNTFKNEVTKLNGVWATQYSSTASDLTTVIEAERQQLTETIGGTFSDFCTGFDTMCEIDETASPETARIHAELNINRAKAEQILNGPMRQAYENLEKGFRGVSINRQ